jgi:hypothetical protein
MVEEVDIWWRNESAASPRIGIEPPGDPLGVSKGKGCLRLEQVIQLSEK